MVCFKVGAGDRRRHGSRMHPVREASPDACCTSCTSGTSCTSCHTPCASCASCDRCGYRAVLGCGALLVLSSVAAFVFWPHVYDLIIRKELTLSPNSTSFKMLKDTPVPITLEFYFFNWTNPESLKTENSTPILVEMGPYIFREKQEKVEVEWHENNTVSFRQVRRWFFDTEKSNGSLNDYVTTLNVVALTAAFHVRHWNYFVQKSLSMTLSTIGQRIEEVRTVGELLFDGYSNPLITMAKTLPGLGNLDIPYDKFGWFYERNGSADHDGLFTVNTGKGDVQQLGKLERWNGDNRTKFFPGACGQINGSGGQLWPPGRSHDDPIAMFSPDLCRSIDFSFLQEQEVYGVKSYMYSGGAELLDNKTDCYCGGQCVPAGVVNVSTCRYGAPAFVSFPHFYLADPMYLRQVEGLEPDAEKHRCYITLEPVTGIPMDVAARFQINILLQPVSYISMLEDVPKIFFPVVWFQQRASITEELAGSLWYLLMVPSVMTALCVFCIITGIALVVVAAMRRNTSKPSSRKKKIRGLDMPLRPYYKDEPKYMQSDSTAEKEETPLQSDPFNTDTYA